MEQGEIKKILWVVVWGRGEGRMVTGGRAGGQLIGNLTPAVSWVPAADPSRPWRCGHVPHRRLVTAISSVFAVNFFFFFINFISTLPT